AAAGPTHQATGISPRVERSRGADALRGDALVRRPPARGDDAAGACARIAIETRSGPCAGAAGGAGDVGFHPATAAARPCGLHRLAAGGKKFAGEFLSPQSAT